MQKNLVIIVVVIAIALGAGIFNRETCSGDQGPRRAVEMYLTSMKDYRFEDAFDYITATMTDNAGIDEWAGMQRRVFEFGEVEMSDPDVRKPHRAIKNFFFCEGSAIVPNVLKAKDKFNNQGSTEFELYTVIKDGTGWKLDSQELLYEEAGIREWFPNDKIPEFEEQM